jgi:hypothetical protein
VKFEPCGWPLCQSDDGIDRSDRTCTGECLAEKIRRMTGGNDAEIQKHTDR